MHTTRLNLLMQGSIVHSRFKLWYTITKDSHARNTCYLCKYNAHTQKEEHNACFHPEVCPYFPIDFRSSLLKIKKFFLRLVIGLSAK
ncbi:hypothetical protein H5410_015341, partial [Solanum commersonii]